VPVVVVLDVAVINQLPAALAKCFCVLVGHPGTNAFEHARLNGRAKICLSYEESRTRLSEVLPLLEEIAEQNAALELSAERARRAEMPTPFGSSSVGSMDAGEIWDFLEGAVENLASREHLLGAFRRATRYFLHASTAAFFLRDINGFRADRAEFSCSADDPLVKYLSHHPAVLDAHDWPGSPDISTEVAVRQRFLQWSARLIAPVHENGKLQGLIVLGVRDDGLAYSAADKMRLISLARLLRQFLSQSAQFTKAFAYYERWKAGEKYLPTVVVLAPDEPPAKTIPAPVRDLIEAARHAGETRRLSASPGQPYRASAGLVPETRGAWACWEDATEELRESMQRDRAERLALLHDLALTLNHEIGNSLVSLAALRHNPGAETNSPVVLAAIKRDIASLETINRHLASIPTFSEVTGENVDLRTLLFAVHRKTGVAVNVGQNAIPLSVAPRLIEFALEAIVESIAENRPGLGIRELSLQLRAIGAEDVLTATISIKGRELALEGILPAPEAGSIPSHGRIGVFIAKEIIRLHGGDISTIDGPEGPEIVISVRKW
jgi:hypothetical protein